MLTPNTRSPGVDTLNLSDLDQPYHCVIQLLTQPKGIIHQVMLRPDKVKNGLIRLGETPGDEAAGWQHPQNIVILSVLGVGKEIIDEDDKSKTHWDVTPYDVA